MQGIILLNLIMKILIQFKGMSVFMEIPCEPFSPQGCKVIECIDSRVILSAMWLNYIRASLDKLIFSHKMMNGISGIFISLLLA